MSSHNIVINDNGDVYVFGVNTSGQLGVESLFEHTKPIILMSNIEIKQISCGTDHSMIY